MIDIVIKYGSNIIKIIKVEFLFFGFLLKLNLNNLYKIN